MLDSLDEIKDRLHGVIYILDVMAREGTEAAHALDNLARDLDSVYEELDNIYAELEGTGA